MARYRIQPQAEDAAGNALAGVAYKAYPHATSTGAVAQDAQGVWTVTVGSLPAEQTVFASENEGDNTPVVLTSQADGSTVVGYLPEGLYTLIGTVGARNFVVPLYEAGTIIRVALGTTTAANDDLPTAMGKIVTKVEALEALHTNVVDGNATLIPDLANTMPVSTTDIHASVAALPAADYNNGEVVKVEFSDGFIYYGSDGTDWTQTGRVVRAAVAADPLTMTFTIS